MCSQPALRTLRNSIFTEKCRSFLLMKKLNRRQLTRSNTSKSLDYLDTDDVILASWPTRCKKCTRCDSLSSILDLAASSSIAIIALCDECELQVAISISDLPQSSQPALRSFENALLIIGVPSSFCAHRLDLCLLIS